MKTCLICQELFEEAASTCPVDGVALTKIDDENLVGKTFVERYEIQDVVGSGGMGLVYKARHLLMHRTVAIKVLTLKAQAETVMRFKAEAQAISVLSHPNILSVFDFGVSLDGQPYMVMDFLEGAGLDAILDREGRLPPDRCVRIFEQISLGLAHAHAKGVIHRDVKPSNVMVVNFEGKPDFVKIVDFGIAKMLRPPTSESENLTRTGEIFGSPMYMSPEQCRGLKLDARADVYSFGAMMYRALSGSPIFDTADVLQIMFHQVTEMPRPFSRVCPEHQIPEALEQIVFKCLAKDPADRFQSMNEIGEALNSLSIMTEAPANTQKVPQAEVLKLKENTICLSEQSQDWIDAGENTAHLEPGFGVAVPDVTVPAISSKPSTESTISIVLPKRIFLGAAAVLIPILGLAVLAVSQLTATQTPEKAKKEGSAPQSVNVDKPAPVQAQRESKQATSTLVQSSSSVPLSRPAKKKAGKIARKPQAKQQTVRTYNPSPYAYRPAPSESASRWVPSTPISQPVSSSTPVTPVSPMVQREPDHSPSYSQQSDGSGSVRSQYAAAAMQAASSTRIVRKNGKTIKKIKNVLNNLLDHF